MSQDFKKISNNDNYLVKLFQQERFKEAFKEKGLIHPQVCKKLIKKPTLSWTERRGFNYWLDLKSFKRELVLVVWSKKVLYACALDTRMRKAATRRAMRGEELHITVARVKVITIARAKVKGVKKRLNRCKL